MINQIINPGDTKEDKKTKKVLPGKELLELPVINKNSQEGDALKC